MVSNHFIEGSVRGGPGYNKIVVHNGTEVESDSIKLLIL